MTGYGRGEAQVGRFKTVAEVKSVNSRFLEVSLKLPQALFAREAEARALVGKAASRGKVDVYLRESQEGGGASVVALDADLAKGYAKALAGLKKALKSRDAVKLETVARMSGVIKVEEAAVEADAEAEAEQRWQAARQALEAALLMFAAARKREGAALEAELEAQMAKGLELLSAIEARSAELVPQMRQRQRQRLSEALEGLSADDPRLVMEAALLADKTDIREELVRFRAHVAEFRRLLAGGGAAGKRLDFLCQELQREVNTSGSKSPDAALAHRVVELKGLVEQVKEQVQNVE